MVNNKKYCESKYSDEEIDIHNKKCREIERLFLLEKEKYETNIVEGSYCSWRIGYITQDLKPKIISIHKYMENAGWSYYYGEDETMTKIWKDKSNLDFHLYIGTTK